MLKIPQEIVNERWDSLPESLRLAVFSPENSETIKTVCLNRNLSPEKISLVGVLVGDTLMGFVHPDNLSGELAQELQIDPALASEIANEINLKIFQPVRDDIEKVYHPLGETAATQIPELPQEKLRPAFAPNSPFMIHEAEEIQTASEGRSRRDLVRPSFYKPQEIEAPIPSAPVAAELEVAGWPRESERKPLTMTSRTAKPTPRVVHYSDFKTPVDPFAKIESEPQEKKKEVHPNNVINLKDLPK